MTRRHLVRLVRRSADRLRSLDARHPRDERGAVAVFVAAALVVLLLAGAMTIDIGVQRVARRDMQAVSDSVSIDLSRLVDGRSTKVIKDGSGDRVPLHTSLDQSMSRNFPSALGSTPDTCPGGGTLSTAAGSCVRAYLVTMNADGTFPTDGDGNPVETASDKPPTAVVVVAKTKVQFGLASVVGIKSGSATRQAVASNRSTACFALGSYAAGLSSQQSALLTRLLNRFLGLNLVAGGYDGLLTSKVRLGALATQLGLGSVDDLATANVTVRSLALATAQVLTNQGDTANAALLNNTIATATGSASTIRLGDVLDLGTGNGAAASATLNALDLIQGAAFVANGTNTVSVPGLATDLGLSGTGLTSTIKVTERPRIYCGEVGKSGSTSQGEVSISGTLASVPPVSGLTGLTVRAGQTDISLDLASARGTMTNIVCGSGTPVSPQGIDVAVTSQLATAARFEQTVSVDGSILATSGLLGNLLGGLLGQIISVEVHGTLKLTASAVQKDGNRSVQVRYPNNPRTWDDGISSGSGDLGLDQTRVSAVWTDGPRITAKQRLLGITSDVDLSLAQIANVTSALVTNLTNGVVGGLLPSVNTSLLQPLQRLLGLEVAGATVFGRPTPNCQTPRLSG